MHARNSCLASRFNRLLATTWTGTALLTAGIWFANASWRQQDWYVAAALSLSVLTFSIALAFTKALHHFHVAALAFESKEAMLVTDANGLILRVNRAFVDLFGYTQDELRGHNPRTIASGKQDETFYQAMWESVLQTGAWAGEIWNRRKDGEVFPLWLTITAVKNRAGKITHYVGAHTDLTQRKILEEESRRLAFLDPLTQLPNRRLLLDRLDRACLDSARTGQPGAVLFIDLDQFKTLNDTWGHDQGDQLLLQVAQRLRDAVRQGDTVARLGGDEFVIVLKKLPAPLTEARAQVRQIGDKILSALAQPYVLGALNYRCTCSIGIALFCDSSTGTHALLRLADQAMYEAKHSGRNALVLADDNSA
jgi:diguanylate cyclase (GGDEF)-like protein/PAS domain S-box-containing protein